MTTLSFLRNFFVRLILVCACLPFFNGLLCAQTAGPGLSSAAVNGFQLSEEVRRAQADSVKEMMIQQEFYVRTTPHEKVFLHLDKPWYTSGDTIWLKAYTMLANTMTPDTLNRTLYVDLVRQDGRVMTAAPLYLQDGMAAGQIAFRDSLVPGYYQVRAYTSWMRNFTDDALFSALVPVYGDERSDKQSRWLFSRSMISGDGTGDTLKIHLQLTDNDFNIWSYKPFSFDIRSRFVKALQDRTATGEDGSADIALLVRKDVRRDVATLRLHVDNKRGRDEKTDFAVSLIRNDSLSFRLLPEGGHLVSGVRGRVAFKALDEGGMAVRVAGTLHASDCDTVLLRFESSDRGMGAFFLTPKPGVDYWVTVHQLQQASVTPRLFRFDLPRPLEKGYVMEVDAVSDGDVQVTIRRRGVSGEEVMGLVARSGGRMTIGKVLSIKSDSLRLLLPRRQFDPGVSQLTLFASDGLPRCERIVFVHKYQPFSIEAAFDKASYQPREKVGLDIKVTDGQGRPLRAALSVSVTDAGLVHDTAALGNTLLTQMLLVSDLRGSIDEPGYFFQDTSRTRREELDLLMLTQGWRRYDLARAREARPDYPWHLEYGIRIPGVVRNITTGRPIPGIQVIRTTGTLARHALEESRWLHELKGWEYKLGMQQNPASVQNQTEKNDALRIHEFDATVTDRDGAFMSSSTLQGDFLSIFSTYKVKGRKQREVATDRRIDLLSPFDTLPGVPFMRHLDLHPGDLQAFLRRQREQQDLRQSVESDARDMKILRDSITTYLLPAVEVVSARDEAEHFAEEVARYRVDAQMATMMVANIDNSVMYPSVEDMLFALYPNKVSYSEYNGYTWEGRPMVLFDLTAPPILPDNMDYRSYDMIYIADNAEAFYDTYDRLKQFPEYWESLMNMNEELADAGRSHFNAVMVFYTRKQTVTLWPGIRKIWWSGYLKPAEFYSPDYAHYDRNDIFDVAESAYDARTTLYWNPDVETDERGEAHLEFYKSDRYSGMRLNVQGMTASGAMGVLQQ